MRKARQAVLLADEIGSPTNRLLTIRTNTLIQSDSGGVFRASTPAKGIKIFLELARKWTTSRGLEWTCIWSREYEKTYGEHFHLGYHSDGLIDEDFAYQVAVWTGESVGEVVQSPNTLFHSEDSGWNIKKRDLHYASNGYLGLYLTKAEPRKFVDGWNKRRKNTERPKGPYGGLGPIQGTSTEDYRWGTSRNIARTQRDRHQYTH